MKNLFLYSSEFDAVRRIFVLEKRLLVSISIFASLIMANETDAEMADAGTEGDELLHCTDWCLCLGPHIAKYIEMTLQSATNV